MKLWQNPAKIYADLRLKTKLSLYVFWFSLWLIIVGSFGIYSAYKTSIGIDNAYRSMRQAILLTAVKSDSLYLRADLAYLLAQKDRDRFDRTVLDAMQRIKTVENELAALNSQDFPAEERNSLRDIEESFSAYNRQASQAVKQAKRAIAADNGRARGAAARLIANVLPPLFQQANDSLADLIDATENDGLKKSRHDMAEYRMLVKLDGGLALLAIALGLLFGWLIYRSVNRPLRNVQQVVDAVANGDLTVSVPVEAHDEIGQLAKGINDMVAQNRLVVAQIAHNSSQVDAAAQQLYNSSVTISTATEQVAAQAATMAVASEELNSTATNIASNCLYAAEGSDRANESATTGVGMVESTIRVMQEIAEQTTATSQAVLNLGACSEEISEIIGTIEDIADQTNLLALNAAIEAARAGEQGRGFAVVADEVRALACRTTKATKEISGMIKAIQHGTQEVVTAMKLGGTQVENGTSEAGKSGDALKNILEKVGDLTLQISQIATSAEEQSATTTEISDNIHQISEVMREASSQAHGSAENAQQMTSLARELREMVERFHVGAAGDLVILELAKQDHKSFVHRIENVVKGELEFSSSEVTDHRHCRFGKWYYDGGAATCGHLPAYREIETPHERLHTLAKASLLAKERGERVKAEQLLGEVASISHHIVELLTRLGRETH